MKVSVTIHKEREWYVAIDPITGVASQGKSIDERVIKGFTNFLISRVSRK